MCLGQESIPICTRGRSATNYTRHQESCYAHVYPTTQPDDTHVNRYLPYVVCIQTPGIIRRQISTGHNSSQ